MSDAALICNCPRDGDMRRVGVRCDELDPCPVHWTRPAVIAGLYEGIDATPEQAAHNTRTIQAAIDAAAVKPPAALCRWCGHIEPIHMHGPDCPGRCREEGCRCQGFLKSDAAASTGRVDG